MREEPEGEGRERDAEHRADRGVPASAARRRSSRRRRPIRAGQLSAKIAPNEVATPFPPLQPSQGEKQWPSTARSRGHVRGHDLASPGGRCSKSSAREEREATRPGAKPLSASSSSTAIAPPLPERAQRVHRADVARSRRADVGAVEEAPDRRIRTESNRSRNAGDAEHQRTMTERRGESGAESLTALLALAARRGTRASAARLRNRSARGSRFRGSACTTAARDPGRCSGRRRAADASPAATRSRS